MQWPPAYNKVILEAGDETAIHSGGKGTAVHTDQNEQNQGAQAEPELVSEQHEEDQDGLEPWLTWMDSIDFEQMWERDLK
jgi:hypothetical protein